MIKQLLSRDQELLENNRELLSCLKEVRTEVQEVRVLKVELQELRQELRTKTDRALELLQQIADKPSPSASPAAEPGYPLSEDEKLLLESFDISASAASAAAAAYNPLLAMQQQHMLMAMAAAQQQQLVPRPAAVRPMLPVTPGMSPYNQQMMGGIFGNPMGMYGVQLPTVPSMAPPVDMSMPPAFGQPPVTPSTPVTINLAKNKPVETGPPTNVVISKSDKIPTVAPPVVSMSVTVPQQHRFGTPSTPQQFSVHPPSTPPSAYKTPGAGPATPHGFQIPLPFNTPVASSPFNTGDAPAVAITTQSLLSSIPTPVYSAVTPSPEKGIMTASGKARMSSGGTPKTRQPSTGEGKEEPEEYEPEVDFKPVVPLPEEVEVITGEEDEHILFEDRAKLFRFADDTKEWKERGLGQAKILKNKETGRVRFLMRRDQTFKVCANHALLPEMKLDLMKGNTKARIWGAQDFSDGEVRTEKFCIKMKTEEQIEKFHAVFEEAVKTAVASSPKKPEQKTEKAPAGKSLADFAAAQKSGSWECGACLTRNDNAKIQCLACESAKPGCEEEVKKLKEATKPATIMTIGEKGGFKFGSGVADAAPAAGGFSFGTPAAPVSATSTTQSGGFSFGTPKTTTAAPAFGASTSSTSVFGSTTTISFGTPKTTAELTFGAATTSTTSAPVFGTPKTTTTNTFGGFTFSSTPTIKKDEEKKPEVKTIEQPKQSLFSGFSFGSGVSSIGSKVEPVKPPAEAAKEEDKPVLGAGTTLSFGSLSKDAAPDAIKKDPNFKGFSTAGSKLFSEPTKPEGEEEGGAEEYEPDVQFQPVIPLPELVEVKTGEEDEDVLFSERSKLYRFVTESKEWKERGVGDFKILKNRVTKKIRFLMRREQVLKLCCNHNLTPDIEIKPMATSDKAWTWTAPDFSEGEIKNEVFGLKFKNSDIANTWKSVVDDCQKELRENPEPAKTAEPAKEVPKGKGKEKPTTLADFAAAQKSGSWECGACLTRNDNAKIQCLACESAKPGCEEEVKKLKEAAKPATIMTIGEKGGFKFSSGTTTPATGSGFTFGSPATTATSGFSFGTPKAAPEDATKPPPFGTKDKHEFSFTGVRTSPRKHNESTTSENDLYQEEEEGGDNIYFEPVIPLPDKVEVRTGEEEETVLYSHKAKVYRYTDGEWKERGVGDIKILRHKQTGKVRLLMRREQVLKICLNHYVNPALVAAFKEKDTKSWTWAAQDFSDGELTSMTFALRFKSPDISSDFKAALDAAVASLGTAAPTTESKPAAAAESKPKTVTKTTVSGGSEDENLFPVKDFKPLEPLEKESELSFDGLGLKLNTEEDAKGDIF